MRDNHLKKLFREGKTAYGIWAALGSPASVEAMSELDLDWILLDAEHGVSSFEACQASLRAMGRSGATSIIRVPANDPVAIKRSLDMGAEGLLVPYIHSAAEVVEIVARCKYPPIGTRGIGPFRASRYDYDFVDYYNRANDEVAVIVQIETRGALDELDAILAVEGLDAVLIGPADLSAAIGHFPNIAAPEVKEAFANVLAAGKKAGIPVGMYCGTPAVARERAEEGYDMINIGNDMSMLSAAMRKGLKQARGE